MNFLQRSYEKELLDRHDIPYDAIERNMQELDTINTWLGGHAISVDGLKQLLKDRRQATIAETGCGGGDNLLAISRYCRRRRIGMKFIGIDINPHCISIARKKLPGPDAAFILSDYRRVPFGNVKPDIIFSSLFCHHFTDEQLVDMLKWMRDNASVGFFINDLQRHPFAYHSIRLLTKWFSRSWLVQHDAPLSVLRGFTREEWKRLLKQAGIEHYSLRWKWAFRWLLIVSKD
jgi:2-polyprenyl-3-methyl-5-hydroxy-6-metoxy-1,4-benzoquinol methylase